MYLRNQWKLYAQYRKYMCIFIVYPGRRDFKAHGKEETGNGICAISSLQLWQSWWIGMRAVADAGQRVRMHFTERHSSQRQFRCGYSPECSHWPMRVRPAANDPRLALRCYSRTSTPWRIRRRLGDIWTCLCLAASPAWPCLWGKHSWESFLHKSCTQEPHFQTLLSGLPTWDTCPPGNHSFCLPASVCKVCTRESSNPPAAL